MRTSHITVSLDGFAAGPCQSREHPLGRGAEALHRWLFEGEDPADLEVREEVLGHDAYVMGRGMFGGGPGPHDPAWAGWWGDEPPYGAPVFVLTHHPREPLVLGATTFHFVTDGLDAALDAAGDGRVSIAGGASVVQQALRRGAIDELTVSWSPLLLGAGARLFEGLDPGALRIVRTRTSALATHVTYAPR